MKRGKEFWTKQIGEGWAKRLQGTLKSEYMNKLMDFLNTEFKEKKIYPEKANVFRAFRETSYEELKVVILGQDPYYKEKMATGLAFGNRFDVVGYSPSLIKIFQQVEREFHDGLYLDFDWSMQDWANQGVLMLNTALTVIHGNPGSHSKPWDKFTTAVINEINEYNSGIIFLLWVAHAKKYKSIIGGHHHVLMYEHPAYAVRQSRDWKCPHFKEVNKILEEKYGEIIKW